MQLVGAMPLPDPARLLAGTTDDLKCPLRASSIIFATAQLAFEGKRMSTRQTNQRTKRKRASSIWRHYGPSSVIIVVVILVVVVRPASSDQLAALAALIGALGAASQVRIPARR